MKGAATKCDSAFAALADKGYVFDEAIGWHKPLKPWTKLWLDSPRLHGRAADRGAIGWQPKRGTFGEFAYVIGQIHAYNEDIDLQSGEVEVHAGGASDTENGLLFLWKEPRVHPLSHVIANIEKRAYIKINDRATLDLLQAAIDDVRRNIAVAPPKVLGNVTLRIDWEGIREGSSLCNLRDLGDKWRCDWPTPGGTISNLEVPKDLCTEPQDAG